LRVMHHGLSTRDVPLPAMLRVCSRLRRTNRFRRRSWDFSLRSFVPGHEVSQRFRCSFPTCRRVGFHLDLFLSRDRPSDIICRGRFRHCPFKQRLGSAFHPHTHEKRPIAEVHLGFWVYTPCTVRFPPSSALRRGDPALGFASSRCSGTTVSAPTRSRNIA